MYDIVAIKAHSKAKDTYPSYLPPTHIIETEQRSGGNEKNPSSTYVCSGFINLSDESFTDNKSKYRNIVYLL